MNDHLDSITAQLMQLGMNHEEAIVYIELLRNPSTHTHLSQTTGINRTKIYRLATTLERKGLISKRSDDHGTCLAANSLGGLELQLIAQEDKLKQQRSTIHDLLADLSTFQAHSPSDFFINTYESTAGLRQMSWNELKATNELLSLGNGTVEEQVNSREWAARHRARQQQAGYKTLEITNYHYETKESSFFTAAAIAQTGLYEHRMVSPEIITFDGQTTIYNNTVAIYHWKHARKVGLEIVSASYALMMRQMFYHYWSVAQPVAHDG